MIKKNQFFVHRQDSLRTQSDLIKISFWKKETYIQVESTVSESFFFDDKQPNVDCRYCWSELKLFSQK